MKSKSTILLALLSFTFVTAKAAKPSGSGGGVPPPPANPKISVLYKDITKGDRIVLMNADGTNATTVVSDGGLANVDLSPTKNELVFTVSTRVSGQRWVDELKLLRYSYDQTGIHAEQPLLLQKIYDSDVYRTDISPDGKYVVYWTVNYSGTNPLGTLHLRSLTPYDPSTDDDKVIYDGPMLRPGGAVWLSASSGYKLALHLPDPASPGDSQILIAPINPLAANADDVMDVNAFERVLSTVGKGITVGAYFESARTSPSLILQATYRNETLRTKPTTLYATRPIIWNVETDYLRALVIAPQEERNYVGPKPSPDDSKLLVRTLNGIVMFDLNSQTSVPFSDGTATDWKPNPPPAN
ncbi:MAG: hypothetical protein ABIZ04_03010 [Opitutus sp.]